MTNIRAVLSFNMKERRKKLELSQAQLAEIIDTSPNYISKIEAEKQFPSVQMIEQLALALNCDTLDLFSIEGMNKQNISIMEEKLCKEINILINKAFSDFL